MKNKLIILAIVCIAGLLCVFLLPGNNQTKEQLSDTTEQVNNGAKQDKPLVTEESSATKDPLTSEEPLVADESGELPEMVIENNTDAGETSQAETADTPTVLDTDEKKQESDPVDVSPSPEPEQTENSEDIDTELPLIP